VFAIAYACMIENNTEANVFPWNWKNIGIRMKLFLQQLDNVIKIALSCCLAKTIITHFGHECKDIFPQEMNSKMPKTKNGFA
jgi:hypothetical protein